MLMAHPAVLADLLDRYETVRARPVEEDTPDTRQQREDVCYTLCVTTGTRDVDTALATARGQLHAAGLGDACPPRARPQAPKAGQPHPGAAGRG